MRQGGSNTVADANAGHLRVDANAVLLPRTYFEKDVARVDSNDLADHLWNGGQLRKIITDLEPVRLGGRKQMEHVALAGVLVQCRNREAERLWLIEILVDKRRSAEFAKELLTIGRVAIATQILLSRDPAEALGAG